MKARLHNKIGSAAVKQLRIAVVVLGIGSCVVAPAARAADDTLKIGTPLALTGALADAGIKQQQGYDICVDAVNAKGGVKIGGKSQKIELVKYDYQSDTNRAIQMVQRLITVDKVSFLFAPYGSGDTKAAAGIAERYGIPMLASSAATTSVFDQGFKNLFGTLFPNQAITASEVAYFSKTLPNAKRLAVLSLNSLYPKSIAADLKTTAEKSGYQLVSDSVYSPGSTDFSNVLTQIKAAKPDWVYVTGYTQDLILIRRQMADLKVTAPIVTMTAGPAYPEYQENLKALAENVTTDSWWHYNADYKDGYLFANAKGYNDAFVAKYKRPATYLEASTTASCQILVQAIEAAGSTSPDAVRKALSQGQFDSFYGPVKFGPNGQNIKFAPLVLQIQKGQIAILAPENLKRAELVVGVGTP
jgi:branched-chain amino acid transport system substrate-binding protein